MKSAPICPDCEAAKSGDWAGFSYRCAGCVERFSEECRNLTREAKRERIMSKESQSLGASTGAVLAIVLVLALIVALEDGDIGGRIAGIFNSLAQLGRIGK